MKNKPIGILDSGVGGLSIYLEIVEQLPHESTVYIGDNARTPYGILPAEEIYERSVELISFLLEKDVKLVVVACNTITVSAIDRLRSTFPHVPIIGTVPVVKTAVATTKTNAIGILSTTRTAGSEYQKNLITQFANGHKVLNLGTDELVPLIEKGILEGPEVHATLKKILAPYQAEHVDTLALGCTHFPFLKAEIQNILGKEVTILDSGAAIARQVKRVLEEKNALSEAKKPTRQFYTTGEADHVDSIAKKLLGGTIASTTVVL